MSAPVSDTESRRRYDAWHSALAEDAGAEAPWHTLLQPHFRTRVPGADVLEIGCGRGGLALRLWHAGPRRLISADFSPVAVEKARAFLDSRGAIDVETRVEDILRMSFGDSSFDVVISCETIEHVVDPVRAVRELARVLRPSGTLLLSTPNYLGLHGLHRAYRRLLGRPYSELGQPINKLVLAPRTARWLTQSGLSIECRLGDGLYIPVPRAEGPLRVPLSPRLNQLLRPLLVHSAFVAHKPGDRVATDD